MAGRIIVVTTLLVLLTLFHKDPPSLHKISAAPRLAIDTRKNSSRLAGVDPSPQYSSSLRGLTEEIAKPVEQSCYAFMLRRPASQRAEAVQARLRHADRMTEAFDPSLLTVDVLGDHANILSLEFPVVWPDKLGYVSRVSSVVDGYFSSPDIKDYLCQSGFAEVRLSARGLNDEQSHPIWKAQVTTAGLLKRRRAPQANPDQFSLSRSEQTAMVLHK
jgi:hypothetical protein